MSIKWIGINEELPDFGEMVFVLFENEEIGVARRIPYDTHEDNFYWDICRDEDFYYLGYYEITHWMPKPTDNTAEKQTCIQILHDLSALLDYETQYKPLLEYVMNH